jgi:hypothetical protein
MTPEQIEKFKTLALEGAKHNCPEGYVYVGMGNGKYSGLGFGSCLITYQNSTKWKTGNPNNPGIHLDWEYACPIKIWEEKTGLKYNEIMKPSITLEELKVKLAAARKLVGKRVRNINSKLGSYLIESVELAIDKVPDNNHSQAIRDFFSKNGYCVILNTDKNTFAFPFEEYEVVKSKLELKLNSEYTAVVSEDGVVVGCQTFTHEKILELADLVRKVILKF